MKSILFVDDEPKILQGLQRMLRGMRDEWEMDFAEGGHHALEKLAAKPVDIVVSDMMMPGMDGAQLLTEVSKRFPQTVRIVLSGHSSKEANLRLVGPAHQYLSKPCEPEQLRETINRACALRDLLRDAKLQEVVSKVPSLPSLPTLYNELVNELGKDEPCLDRIGETISKDIAMSAKMLQLVNSAFFGLPREISSPTEAAIFLGVDTIKALTLALQIFSQFKSLSGLSAEALWNHSWITGVLARRIAGDVKGEKTLKDQAFMAGMLHDIGKLILMQAMPNQFMRALSTARERKLPLWRAEHEVLGASHAEVGAYLLGLWGLPSAILEAVALHHRPEACLALDFCPLSAVYLANLLSQESRSMHEGVPLDSIDQLYLQKLGVDSRLPEWRSALEQA